MKVVQKSASKPNVPSLRHHKASGRAYVVLNNRTIYVGDYGTEEAVQNYNKTIAEWLASNKQTHSPCDHISINKLLARFWAWAENYIEHLMVNPQPN